MASPDKTPQRPAASGHHSLWVEYSGELEAEVVRLRQENEGHLRYIAAKNEQVERLREALQQIEQLVRHEWRLKHHEPGFVLATIEQVLDGVASPDKPPDRTR